MMSKDIVDFFIAGAVGLLGWFFGGLDGFMSVLLSFMVIDYIMGLSIGYVRHELNSTRGFQGILKKIFMLFLVGIAHVIDELLPNDTAALRTVVCLFYIANEGISILENADTLGIPIPEFLKNRLLTIKEQGDNHGRNKETKEIQTKIADEHQKGSVAGS